MAAQKKNGRLKITLPQISWSITIHLEKSRSVQLFKMKQSLIIKRTDSLKKIKKLFVLITNIKENMSVTH